MWGKMHPSLQIEDTRMRYLWILLIVVVGMPSAAAEMRVETFLIKSRPAVALVETVRPLLGADASVSAYHDRLIVRGTPGDMQTVRELLRDLDRPLRRLVIEVRRGGSVALSTEGIGYGVDTGEVRLGRVPPGGGAGVQVFSAETRGRNDSLQRVRVLDGQPALIRTGRSTPVYEGYRGIYGNRVVQGFSVQYRDTATGFYAVPRVHGRQVTVEIYQQQEHLAPGQTVDRQQASTTLSGALGQWLTLGSVGDSRDDSGGGIGQHYQTRRAQDMQLELRVLSVD